MASEIKGFYSPKFPAVVSVECDSGTPVLNNVLVICAVRWLSFSFQELLYFYGEESERRVCWT